MGKNVRNSRFGWDDDPDADDYGPVRRDSKRRPIRNLKKVWEENLTDCEDMDEFYEK